MDRRAFLALGVLAAAASMPAFSQQVRTARETGQMLHVRPATLVRAIYRVAMSRNGASAGARALMKLGYNRAEATEMTNLTISIARKSGSVDNFLGLARATPPRGVRLDERELALLRTIAGRAAAARAGPFDGRTWEGGSGDTWVSRSMVANPAVEGERATIWDGRTWEGSAM